MSEILPASCQNNVVSVEGLQIPSAEILSEGVAASEGVLLFEKDKQYYIPKNSTDLKDVLTQLDGILQQIITISTGLDAASTSPGSQTANIAQLTTLKNNLATKKDALK